MFKKLLTLAAAASMAFGAYAAEPVVLWTSESEDGVLVDWGEPCYVMTADEITAVVTPGDYLNMVIAGVTEGGWPQVALNKAAGGWPPYCNSGVGGLTYPLTVTFPVTVDLYNQLKTDGVMFTGNGAYVSEVSYAKGTEISDNTVWFGEKVCGWGNGVGLAGSIFADIKVGDKLMFWTSDQSFQVLLGSWSGLNIPCYAADNYDNVTYEDGVATYTMIEQYATENTYGEGDDAKVLDVFTLIKNDGVYFHGTTTLTRVDYIPVPETTSISAIEAVDAAPVYYNLQGVRVENPNNGIYIVKRGNKVAKQVIK